jgi:hypothetical protein
MEMLGAWVPTTPEMEVKLVFGAHIWDVAQHADSFGKRTHELRLPLQHSLEPSRDYIHFLDKLAATVETNKRIAGFYDCVLPGLNRMFRDYLERVDPLLDGPTVRILDRILSDIARMMNESKALREEVPSVGLDDVAWLDNLRRIEASLGEVVPHHTRAVSAA